MKIKPLPCPFCGTAPKFNRMKEGEALPEIPNAYWVLSCKNKTCGSHPMAFGDKKPAAVADWNKRNPVDLLQLPLKGDEILPYVARCGSVLALVNTVEELAPGFVILRVRIIEGMHFNDNGDFGPGDEVSIGPITDHWRRVSVSPAAH